MFSLWCAPIGDENRYSEVFTFKWINELLWVLICRESYIIGDDKTKQISTAEFQAMVRMFEQHTALTVYNDYDGFASFIHITLHVIQN